MDAVSFMTFSGKRNYRSARLARALPWLFGALWLAMAGAPPAVAQSAQMQPGAGERGVSQWSITDYSRVRLLAAVEAVGEGEQVILGLQFILKKDWKIYWRSPGDAGFPPQLDWTGSENLKEAKVFWPAPERFSVIGFETLGYKDEVVLPITATIVDPGLPLRMRLQVNYLACAEICIPYDADFSLDLPPGPAKPSAFVHAINRFSAKVPGDGSAQGLTIARAGSADNGNTLRVVAESTLPFVSPDLFVEGPDTLAFGPPRVRLENGDRRTVMDVEVFRTGNDRTQLAGEELVLTLIDGRRSAERKLKAAATINTRPVGGEVSIYLILVLAVVGGLILNLMPCVLPVLSIKLLGIVGHGGGEARTVRFSFMASAAGILAAFMVLAAALVGLKASGAAIGWGIQFQQPWFLVAMALVVILFACNLWGFFEVRLPYGLADIGERAGRGRGLGGHFLSGAFATLLATPCSAPFLGTAIGFALARGTGEIFSVFAALGIGLALPYLTVAAWPGLATRLPRPGPWMMKLRRVLGFALALTAVWLLTVLDGQTGSTVAMVTGIILAAIIAFLYLASRGKGRFGRVWTSAVAALAVAAFLPPSVLRPDAPAQVVQAAEAGGIWVPFDQAAIPRLVGEGKTVFVDVTADWCITCQVNKAFVLEKGDVLDRLMGDKVVAMQADWTRPDESISRYLASFGRYGIPFNVVYGPGTPQGKPLPELLTQGAVVQALDQAASTAALSSR